MTWDGYDTDELVALRQRLQRSLDEGTCVSHAEARRVRMVYNDVTNELDRRHRTPDLEPQQPTPWSRPRRG